MVVRLPNPSRYSYFALDFSGIINAKINRIQYLSASFCLKLPFHITWASGSGKYSTVLLFTNMLHWWFGKATYKDISFCNMADCMPWGTLMVQTSEMLNKTQLKTKTLFKCIAELGRRCSKLHPVTCSIFAKSIRPESNHVE